MLQPAKQPNWCRLWRLPRAQATRGTGAFRAGLDGDIRARAAGDGRLGADLFARKLRLTLGSDISPDELRRKAWADYAAVRREMLRLARDVMGDLVPRRAVAARWPMATPQGRAAW